MDLFYLPSEISNLTAILMIAVSMLCSFISAAAGILVAHMLGHADLAVRNLGW